jgi:hypothetical protein
VELYRIQPDTQRFFPAEELDFANARDAAQLIDHISGKIVA